MIIIETGLVCRQSNKLPVEALLIPESMTPESFPVKN